MMQRITDFFTLAPVRGLLAFLMSTGTRGGATYEAEAGGADGWSGRRGAKEIGKRTAEGLGRSSDGDDAGTEGSTDSNGCWHG